MCGSGSDSIPFGCIHCGKCFSPKVSIRNAGDFSHFFGKFFAGGIELCAFGSYQFKKNLPTATLELIIGHRIVDTPDTDALFDQAKMHMGLIPEDDFRYQDSIYFFSHTKKKKDIGHCVCFDGTTVDITSKQFGLPMFYSLEYFQSIFEKIDRDCDFSMDDIKQYGDI